MQVVVALTFGAVMALVLTAGALIALLVWSRRRRRLKRLRARQELARLKAVEKSMQPRRWWQR